MSSSHYNNPFSDYGPKESSTNVRLLTRSSSRDLSGTTSSTTNNNWYTPSDSHDDSNPPEVPSKNRSTSSMSILTHDQTPTSVLDSSNYDSYCLDNLTYNRTDRRLNDTQFYGNSMNSDYLSNNGSSSMTGAKSSNAGHYDASAPSGSGYNYNYSSQQGASDGLQGVYSQNDQYSESASSRPFYPRHQEQPQQPQQRQMLPNSAVDAENILTQPTTLNEDRIKTLLSKPWIVWFLSCVQLIVFIAEFIKMGVLTGSPIQTKPSFNPMIGPSSYLLINMGARFTPCMHAIPGVTNVTDITFPCPNSTTTDTNVCSLSELCGMGGTPDPSNTDGSAPDQWWRFITPIFLHAGIIHIGFNLLLQLKLGTELEKGIGHIRFFIIYFAAGIGGFVLGGNFTPAGIASTGASGSLFGIIALDMLDLLFNWQLYQNPKRALLMHIIEVVVSFAIGLLPGLDNFSHIGGFVIGLLLGIALLRSPLPIRKRVDSYDSSGVGRSHRSQSPDLFPGFSPTKNGHVTNVSGGTVFAAEASQERLTHPISKAIHFNWLNPKQHFVNRAPLWYLWLFVRLAAIALTVAYFAVLITQFENGGAHCSWCKYLSCIPVNGWCDEGDITTSTSSSSSSSTSIILVLFLLFSKQFKDSLLVSQK